MTEMIQVQHLMHHYGDLVAVDDVSFDIPRGEIRINGLDLCLDSRAAMQGWIGYLSENGPVWPEMYILAEWREVSRLLLLWTIASVSRWLRRISSAGYSPGIARMSWQPCLVEPRPRAIAVASG